MKNVGWIVVALIAIVTIKMVGFYNSMAILGPKLDAQYAQVQNMYERRADLIPQLAAVVKKYTQYESGTLIGIVNARNEASKNLEILTKMVEDGKVQNADFSNLLTSTMAGLKVAVEAYPQLKGDTQFTALFTELEGSENRIRTEIKAYNDAVASYNAHILTFPNNLMAKVFGIAVKQSITPPSDKPIKDVPNVDKLLE